MASSRNQDLHMMWFQVDRSEVEGNGYLVWQTIFYKYVRTNMYHSHLFFKCDVQTPPARGKVYILPC